MKIFLFAFVMAAGAPCGAQVGTAAAGTRDGQASAKSLRPVAGYYFLIGSAGAVVGWSRRNDVDSVGDALFGGFGIGAVIGLGGALGLWWNVSPSDDVMASIEGRPEEYQVAFERAFREERRRRDIFESLIAGSIFGAAYTILASAGNDRFDQQPSFTILSASVRF